MAATDRAVVVGISVYPDFNPLVGPENDASDFYDWLVDPTGGDVPAANVTRIVSSAFQAAGGGPQRRQPDACDVERPFHDLQREALDPRTGIARQLGRRLYVYLAGHGVGLPFPNDPERTDAALLTADATNWNAPNVLARVHALYFLNAGIFQEIAVFMDCCRKEYSRLVPRLPAYIDVSTLEGAVGGRRAFFAFATEWGETTRERMINGRQRGVFTAALLNGLRHGADRNGKVTSDSLREYLLNRMASLLTPEERAAGAQPTEPYIPNPERQLEFATVAPPTALVRLRASKQVGDVALRVRGAGFAVVARGVIPAGGVLEVDLPRDNYLAELIDPAGALLPPVDGKPFSVVGDEAGGLDVDVG